MILRKVRGRRHGGGGGVGGGGRGKALVLFGLSGHTAAPVITADFDEDNNELIRFVKTNVFVFSHV